MKFFTPAAIITVLAGLAVAAPTDGPTGPVNNKGERCPNWFREPCCTELAGTQWEGCPCAEVCVFGGGQIKRTDGWQNKKVETGE
ncbi:hypothetical protein NLG97_g10307 [Lecanicillium saksenae]|uniref:Uncharacterized protein n=1 Tax=Lecanicillium saksenae TaxID=468837 RepID=A0ACC1QDK4_9HYPO|nr:hypothetical protein NLG97_g10307 [Lecanicillium saksenae]